MNEQDFAIEGGALRLADWGLIRAQGEEAAKFLHGQLTQDLLLQGPHEARLAGYCSPKGRLLALMLALRPAEDERWLALPAELLPATLKRLSMFVLRAKCKLSDASAALAVWGLAGAAAEAWLGESRPSETWAQQATASGGWVVKLPGSARYLLVQPAEAEAPALPALSAADWAWLEAAAGLAWVRQPTVEQFVPQMLNLELLGGVNFKKGCYPGQEIVARSQYRGTIKRRTWLFSLDGTAQIGQELFHSEDPGQPAGLVAAVATREGRSLLLAEVKLAALDTGQLHLGSATGPQLRAEPMPYTVGEPE